MLLSDMPARDSNISLLEKFYIYHNHSGILEGEDGQTQLTLQHSRNYFQTLFPSFAEFNYAIKKRNNVSVVVAFVTGTRETSEPTPGTLEGFITRTNPDDQGEEQTLAREKNLERSFDEDNVQSLIWDNFSEEIKENVCFELDIPGPSDVNNFDTSLACVKILSKLEEMGYCIDEDKESGSGRVYPVSGKLLKLKSSSQFDAFTDRAVNQQVFMGFQRSFLSGFPSFIPKLELKEIYDKVIGGQKLNIKFTEIHQKNPEEN